MTANRAEFRAARSLLNRARDMRLLLLFFLCVSAALSHSSTAAAQEPGTPPVVEPAPLPDPEPTPAPEAPPADAPAPEAPPDDAPAPEAPPADAPAPEAPPAEPPVTPPEQPQPEPSPTPERASDPEAVPDDSAATIDAPVDPAARPSVDQSRGGLDSDDLEDEEGPLVPWRGSVLEYRNAFGIRNLDPYADLTHNPYYVMALSVRPRWWLDDVFNVYARLDVARELTEPDDTTFANETVLHDLYLGIGAKQLLTIPEVEIHVSPDLRLTIPTSKASRSRTLVLGVGPGVAFTRSFDFDEYGELTVGYRPRFTINFHRSTTAQRDTALIPTCLSCEQHFNTGRRNAAYRLWNGVDVGYTFLERFGVSVSYAHVTDWLYRLSGDPPGPGDGVPDGGADSVTQDDPPTVRFSSAFGFEVSVTPIDMLEVGIGWETLSPQLSDGSTYYNPIYNRYSQAYVDLRLQVDALVAEIQDL